MHKEGQYEIKEYQFRMGTVHEFFKKQIKKYEMGEIENRNVVSVEKPGHVRFENLWW